MVFRYEYVFMVWFWELDFYSVIYCLEKKKVCDLYIFKKVVEKNVLYCYCGLLKLNFGDDGCLFCMSSIMKLVKEVVRKGEIFFVLKILFNIV